MLPHFRLNSLHFATAVAIVVGWCALAVNDS